MSSDLQGQYIQSSTQTQTWRQKDGSATGPQVEGVGFRARVKGLGFGVEG